MKTSPPVMTLALLCASVASIDCGGRSLHGHDGERSGTIGLALELAPGATLTEATYTLTGPGGFERTVTVRLGGSRNLTTLIGATPPGTGYVLSINGVASDGVVCSGTSSPFDVISGRTTMVVLNLQCHERERAG